jgi:hypothetical protein
VSRVTPSKLALAIFCPPSLALPEVREAAGEPAERGSIIHAFLYAARTADPKTALEEVPARYREICAAIDVQKLVDTLGAYEAEVAFAWAHGSDRGRVIGKNVGRDYGDLADDEIPGSLDACRFDPETRTLYIADWKTGFSWIEHPQSNPQLRAYALMAARAFGAIRVVVLIVVFDEEGNARMMRAEFDDFELDAIAHEVRTALQAVLRITNRLRAGEKLKQEEVTLGEHCRYCPAIFNCPGIVAASQSLVADVDRSEAITTEEVGRMWAIVAAVAAAADKTKKILRPIIIDEIEKTGAPFPLPNGKVLKLIAYPVDKIDPLAAFRFAQERGMSTIPLAQEASLSKAGIARAFDGNEDEAAGFIEQLRGRGGVTQEERTKLAPVNAPKKK